MTDFTVTPSGQIYSGTDGLAAMFSRLFDFPCMAVSERSERRVVAVNSYGQTHSIEVLANGDLTHDGKLY